MAKLYVRDGIYYADCTYFVGAERKRAQRTTGVRADGTAVSRKTAERTAREIEGALVAGQSRKARGQTLREAYRLRIEERTLAGGAEASLEIIGQKSEYVLAFFGATRDVSTITDADLRRYAVEARRSRSIASVQRELTELRCAMRAAGVDPPPAPELGTPKPNEVWLTSEDSSKLLRSLAHSRREHALVYRLTGVRYSELHRLEAIDILEHGGRTLLRVRGTKTEGADRTFPVHEQVEAVLRQRAKAHPAGPLFPDVWLAGNGNRDLTLAARKAGLRFQGRAFGGEPTNPQEGLRLGFNVLRASFCTELVLADVALKKIAYLMGHKSTHMVERVYTRFFGSEVGLDLGAHLAPIGVTPVQPEA